MEKYSIIEAKRWQHKDGRTASIYGAVPYYSNNDGWEVVTVGYTLQNNSTGTVGIGRKPFKTLEEAQEYINA